MSNQRGFAPILILIAALGLLIFLLITNTFSFKDKLFSSLFPKRPSHAAELTRNLTNQLLKEVKEYSLTSGNQKAEVLSKLKETALRRKEIMIEDLKVEPEAFLLNTMSPKLTNRLPKEIAELIESQIVVEGPLDISIAENFEDHKSEKFYKIDKYTLHFVHGDPMDKISKLIDKSGNKFKVMGFGYAADIVVDLSSDFSLVSSPTSTKGKRKISGVSSITGPRKAAAILFNFKDNSETPFAKSDVENTLFDESSGARSLANYYLDNSYKRISLSGDVYDWVTIDVDSSAGCNHSDWANLANTKAKEKYGFNYDNYDHVLYISPDVSGCWWSGYGSLGILSSMGNILGKNTWYNGRNNVGIFAHEIGHNLGLLHAGLKSCTSSTRQTNCDVKEFGDPLDPMGIPIPFFAHLNDMHENKLGWMNAQKATNKKIYDIYPLGDPVANSSNLLQTLRIDKGPTYYVSYYQPIGFDKSLSDINPLVLNNSQGVVIHSGQSYKSSDSLLMLLPEMKALSESSSELTLLDSGIFYDEGNGVEIKQLAHDSSKATVQVTFTNGSCIAFPPTVSVQTADGTIGTTFPGGFINYTVTIFNNDSSACSPATFNLSSAVPDGWQSSFSPTPLTLSPGQLSASTWTVTSASDAPDNIYNILASAQNQSDTSLKSTAITSFIVSSILTPPSTCSSTSLTCTFGKTNIGNTRDPNGSNQWGTRAELSQDGDVGAINAYLEWDGNGSDFIKALIYNNVHDDDTNTDTPGNLVAESVTRTFSTTPAWVTFSFDNIVSLDKGTYWLSVLGEESGVYGYYNDDGNNLTYFKDGAAFSPPDDPAQVTSTQTRTYSIYADYSLGSSSPQPSPTPTPTSCGTFISKWGSYGSGDGQFKYPTGIAIDASGNVYVVDMINQRIQKFTLSGGFISKWGSSGFGDGQFSSPYGIAIDAGNNVYVADTGGQRIQKFTSNGTFISKWGPFGSGDGQFSNPTGIAIDGSNNVYVADSNNHRIQKFTSNGTFITKWGSSGFGDGQFNFPWSIAIDAGNSVYVVDRGNLRIQKFTLNGTFISKWGSSGSGDGQFSSPDGVGVDASNNVYVADAGNRSIQKFTLSGEFISKWGSSGSGDGQFFNGPTGIAIDGNGNVYVTDYQNHRVQKFYCSAATP